MTDKVTKDCTVTFGPGHTPLSVYTIRLPAGLRVKEITGEPRRPRAPKQYFLDELPETASPPYCAFPRYSVIRHDATHYGVRLEEDQVQDCL